MIIFRFVSMSSLNFEWFNVKQMNIKDVIALHRKLKYYFFFFFVYPNR